MGMVERRGSRNYYYGSCKYPAGRYLGPFGHGNLREHRRVFQHLPGCIGERMETTLSLNTKP